MQLAKRIEKLPPYLFAEISRKIAEKRAQGVDIVSFAIGDPDIPTPSHVIDALCQACGACVAACPNKASDTYTWNPAQVLAMTDVAEPVSVPV